MYRVIKASEDVSLNDAIGKLNSMPMKRGVSKVSYGDIEDWQAVLRCFPIGTVIHHDTDEGTQVFTKTDDGKFGWWDVYHPHPPHTNHCTEFDVARYMAGSGVISRGKFVLQ